MTGVDYWARLIAVMPDPVARTEGGREVLDVSRGRLSPLDMSDGGRMVERWLRERALNRGFLGGGSGAEDRR